MDDAEGADGCGGGGGGGAWRDIVSGDKEVATRSYGSLVGMGATRDTTWSLERGDVCSFSSTGSTNLYDEAKTQC
jgi:hypothetical protein